MGLESKKLGTPLKGSISTSSLALLVLGFGEVSARFFFFFEEDFFRGDFELLGVVTALSRIDADGSSESSAGMWPLCFFSLLLRGFCAETAGGVDAFFLPLLLGVFLGDPLPGVAAGGTLLRARTGVVLRGIRREASGIPCVVMTWLSGSRGAMPSSSSSSSSSCKKIM